jgi:hypothetical protein
VILPEYQRKIGQHVCQIIVRILSIMLKYNVFLVYKEIRYDFKMLETFHHQYLVFSRSYL